MRTANRIGRLILASAFAGALAGVPALSSAQTTQSPPGPGAGPGMMGGGGPGAGPGPGYGAGRGAGPGYARGYGSGSGGGWGPGPGMMGGYGPGYGYGMGPGMMGGYGPGYGRYGMGPGMMGGLGYRLQGELGLSDEQRTKLNAVSDELRRTNWAIAGKMMDESSKLQEVLSGTAPDRKAAVATYQQLSQLRQQRFEAMLDAQAKIRDVLTPEQREALHRWGPWWMDEGS